VSFFYALFFLASEDIQMNDVPVGDVAAENN
jgi:hypothetical protein